jgi:hypothetical protein
MGLGSSVPLFLKSSFSITFEQVCDLQLRQRRSPTLSHPEDGCLPLAGLRSPRGSLAVLPVPTSTDVCLVGLARPTSFMTKSRGSRPSSRSAIRAERAASTSFPCCLARSPRTSSPIGFQTITPCGMSSPLVRDADPEEAEGLSPNLHRLP